VTSLQQRFDDLGTPLCDVTFCVLDLETTGGDPGSDTITEIGAIKVRGGESDGTFQTLVNPGRAIPPTVTVLTGITEMMVMAAPRIESVLASLLTFIGDSVIVGHNVRFDMGFLQAALERDERPRLSNRTVDTVALARRLVRDEVPNCRLGTLAARFRLPHQPSHRALDDALATADLLHVLLDRAAGLGVTGLDDLSMLPKLAAHPQAAKLTLTERLPRSPGVYLFRNDRGEVLYVGKATDLRSRVRSYFSSDDRRKVGALLRETARIDHKATPTVLEAEALEIRLIHHLEPHYNRVGTRSSAAVYLRLGAERFPRLAIAREPQGGRRLLSLGPATSRRVATDVIDAIHTVIPLRRCSRPAAKGAPCSAAQLGTALCPCQGGVSEADYARLVERLRLGLTTTPSVLIDPLVERMRALAAEERFEEAASTRDRAVALAEFLRRSRRIDDLRRVEWLVVADRDGHRFAFRRGQLARYWAPTADDALGALDPGRAIEAMPDDPGDPAGGPIRADLADEVLLTARWLERNAGRIRVVEATGTWAGSVHPVPTVGPPRPAERGSAPPGRPRRQRARSASPASPTSITSANSRPNVDRAAADGNEYGSAWAISTP
jgi:DNA polymerase-3 subunit epsilon